MANRTALARKTRRIALIQRRKQRLHAEIAAFASKHGGSALDLDEALERAGIESLQALDRQAMRDVEAGIRAAIDLDSTES